MKKYYAIDFTGGNATKKNCEHIRAMFFDNLDTTFDRCIFEGAYDKPTYTTFGLVGDNVPYGMSVLYKWYNYVKTDFKALYEHWCKTDVFSNVEYHKNGYSPYITFEYDGVNYKAEVRALP